MAQKFVDKSGVEHFDDSTIEDSDGFLRRISEDYWHPVENRITSVAFGPEDISFSLESLISPQEFHAAFPLEGLLKLKASQLRSEGEVLERKPCGKSKSDLAHALSWGKRSKTIKKKLQSLSEILIPFPVESSPE